MQTKLIGGWTPKEKSAGAVIFRREEKTGKIFYLLLHYHLKGHYWDFPRGKIELGESEQQTALREIKEETGLEKIKMIESFREVTHWYYRWKGQNIYKEAVYFLAEAFTDEVRISDEHLEFIWLDFRDAMKKLTYDNTKQILKAAHSFLQKLEKGKIEKFLNKK